MTLADTVIKTAKAEVGYHEGRDKAGHWDNQEKFAAQVPGLAWANYQPWCCTFVSWCAHKGGAGSLFPMTASCDAAGAWFKAKGRWSEYPAIGAQVFYGSTRDLSHTGIVWKYDATYIYTIEGNTNDSGSREGDGVYLKKRVRRDDYVVGYGYPNYPGGIKSADPQWSTGHKVVTPSKPIPKPAGPKPARADIGDISHYQTGMTLTAFKKAKAAGLKGIYHKCTEGSGFSDLQYATRRRLVGQAGLHWGGYHFARPSKSSGTAQAKQFLAKAKLVPGDLKPMLDLEDRGGMTEAQLGKWVGDFIAECERQLGQTGGYIYTPFDLSATHGWDLWVARYSDAMKAPNVPDPWHDWSLWQFSNGVAGHPDNIAGLGHIDLSTCNWSAKAELVKMRMPTQKPKPKPTPTPPAPTTPYCTFANVQCNVQQTDPATTAIKHIKEVSAYGFVIGWNELGTTTLQKAVQALPNFDSYFGPNVSSGAIAISWRSDHFERVDAGYLKVHSGIAHITPARYIVWVRLRAKQTGLVFTRVNTHVVHHTEVAGLPRVKGAISGQNARAKKHFAMLHDVIVAQSHYGPVVTGGDFNVDYLAEKRLAPSKRCAWFPYTLLSPVAKPFMSDHGTEGGRAIDWTLLTGTVTGVSQIIEPRGSSDHNPVRSTVTVR